MNTPYRIPSGMSRILLLVPVYPDEVTIRQLVKSTGVSGRTLKEWLSCLAADFPLAERTEGRSTILCWPTIEKKKECLGWRYVI